MCVNDMIETTICVLHLHVSMLLHVVTTSHKTLKIIGKTPCFYEHECLSYVRNEFIFRFFKIYFPLTYASFSRPKISVIVTYIYMINNDK